MKVRYKDYTGPYDYTVVEESPNYYIVYGTGGKVAVSKADYKPVQEWVPMYSFEMCGMKGKEIRAVHSGNGFITVEVKR